MVDAMRGALRRTRIDVSAGHCTAPGDRILASRSAARCGRAAITSSNLCAGVRNPSVLRDRPLTNNRRRPCPSDAVVGHDPGPGFSMRAQEIDSEARIGRGQVLTRRTAVE